MTEKDTTDHGARERPPDQVGQAAASVEGRGTARRGSSSPTSDRTTERGTGRVWSLLVGALALALVLPATLGAAQAADLWLPERTLEPSDGQSGQLAGRSVAIDGDTAVTGAMGDDNANGQNAGAVYVHVRDADGAWIQQAKLTASDGSPDDFFGRSVDLVGDRLIVGAVGAEDADDEKTGAAYIFTRNGGGVWTEETKLTASDGASGDEFGWDVSLDDGHALVAAWKDDNAQGTDAGAAYVFAEDTATGVWTQESKLTASDGDARDHFGVSVSLDGGTAAVGAYDNPPATEGIEGATYVLEHDVGSWTQVAKLTVDEANTLGRSVAVDDDTLLVGAFRANNENGQDAGSVYVFTRTATGWTQQARLLPLDGDDEEDFGDSVALEGGVAVIGAGTDGTLLGEEAGAAYVFEQHQGTWIQEAKLFSTDREAGDRFGRAVDVSGETAIVGAMRDDNANGQNAGAAFLFSTAEELVEDRA